MHRINQSLAKALKGKTIGDLNPVPWGLMSGNCLGWLIYAYYSRDPFILVSNIGGILVSFWLNLGASKLQYHAEIVDSTPNTTISIFTKQDMLLLIVLVLWMLVLVAVGWLGICTGIEKEVVGLLANINVLLFYAAPLQTMKRVITEKRSDSIHKSTMILNCVNAGFWGAYGIARNDIIIYGPNAIGFFLSLTQAALCCMFPTSSTEMWSEGVDDGPLLDDTVDHTEAE